MICQHCGNVILQGQKFCRNCCAGLQNQLTAADYYLEGYYYYSGTKGYPTDYQKAYYFFAQSGSLGNLEAINYIGLMYLDGNGVAQNTSIAIDQFRQALSINPKFGRAHFNLGRIFYHGIGVQKDYDRAYEHLLYALKYGKEMSYYGYACHFVGYILMEVQKRPAESVGFFREAAKRQPDFAEAWYNLGLLCELGYYKPDDGTTEMDYYKRAAELGYVNAMEAVGKLYLRIALATRSYQRDEAKRKAAMWLQKAVDGGSKTAKIGLFSAKCPWSENNSGASHSSCVSYSSTPNSFIQPAASTQEEPQREFTFHDARGNYSVSGGCFYDFRGNLCEWGKPFYDSRGNLCEWGGNFYDAKDNLCTWGSPFYDSKGYYIVP